MINVTDALISFLFNTFVRQNLVCPRQGNSNNRTVSITRIQQPLPETCLKPTAARNKNSTKFRVHQS